MAFSGCCGCYPGMTTAFEEQSARTSPRCSLLGFLCIVATVANICAVGNVAHAAAAALGALLGYAIAVPRLRFAAGIALSALLIVGTWGATLGRPFVNVSRAAAYDEGKLGYDALMRNDNVAAQRWLQDAARLEPESACIWYDLGIAHARQGRIPESTRSRPSQRGLQQGASRSSVGTPCGLF
jgi:hypothetical protein